MILVGLTGGVATGKSTVRRCSSDARHLDRCDKLAVSCRPGKPAGEPSSNNWETVLNQNRSLDVKPRQHRLQQSEETTATRTHHPSRVAASNNGSCAGSQAHTHTVVITKSTPLRAGVDKRVDKIIVISATRTQIVASRKETASPAQKRSDASKPNALAKKTQQADYVLNGTLSRPSLWQASRPVIQHLPSHLTHHPLPCIPSTLCGNFAHANVVIVGSGRWTHAGLCARATRPAH